MYGYVDSPQIQQLSRYVFAWESEDFDVDVWVGEGSAAHSLVLDLDRYDKNGVSGALAYLAEGGTANAPKIIRWMMAGAFKGQFDTDAEFCRDQFADAIDDHFAVWSKRVGLGLPEVELSSLIDWDEVAYVAVGGPVMDRDDQVFYSIVDASGVYVFDESIPQADYDE